MKGARSARVVGTAIFLGVLLTATVVLPSAITADAVDGRERAALEFVSRKYDVPVERLVLVADSDAVYPYSGHRVWSGKVLDTVSGHAYAAHVTASGKVLADTRALDVEERKARLDVDGKRSAALSILLENVAPEDPVDLAVWLRQAASTQPKPEGDVALVESAVLFAKKQKAVADAQHDFLRFLEERGFVPSYVSKYAPLVFVRVPAGDADSIEAQESVVGVDRTYVYEPEMNTAPFTERANEAWARKIDGLGQSVAIVEPCRIEFANPNLPPGLSYDPLQGCTSDHATAIAGMLGSRHATYPGVAPMLSTVYNANAASWSDSDMINATEWAISNGVRVISNSWGFDTNRVMGPMDHYMDHLVWEYWVTVTKSAGNRGNGDGDVTSPGLGYNMLTVGAFSDANTAGWGDDAMASYSSYGDPTSPHGDREKPEVSAVGSSITATTTASPWVGEVGSGTSYAGPQVAAQAAMLMERASWLRIWPETLKAVIMATAEHNIEGATRLSESDGAGGINVGESDEAVLAGRLGKWTLTSATTIRHPMNLPAGQTVRLAVAWDSHPDFAHPPASDPLMADLDLYILDPSGNIVASSLSWDNSYEIVEFDSGSGGLFEARIYPFRFDAPFEYVGLGYHLR